MDNRAKWVNMRNGKITRQKRQNESNYLLSTPSFFPFSLFSSSNANAWAVLRCFSQSPHVNCNVNSNVRMGKTELAFQIIHCISFGIGQVPKLHSTDCCFLFLFNLCQIICQNCRKKKKKLCANMLVIEDTFVKCFPQCAQLIVLCFIIVKSLQVEKWEEFTEWESLKNINIFLVRMPILFLLNTVCLSGVPTSQSSEKGCLRTVR